MTQDELLAQISALGVQLRKAHAEALAAASVEREFAHPIGVAASVSVGSLATSAVVAEIDGATVRVLLGSPSVTVVKR